MASRAGSPNKNKAFLLNRLKDMFGNSLTSVGPNGNKRRFSFVPGSQRFGIKPVKPCNISLVGELCQVTHIVFESTQSRRHLQAGPLPEPEKFISF